MLEKRQVITVVYLYFNVALTCHLDTPNNLSATSLLTDVMEELGLGDVDDLEGNF